MRFVSIVLLTLAFIAPLPATADEQDDTLKAVLACRTITDDTDRLACMDTAIARLGQAPALQPSAPADVPISPAPAPTPPIPPQQPIITQSELEAERAAIAAERAEIAQARAELEANSQSQSENERLGVLARLGLARNAEKKDDEGLAATITIDRAVANRNKIYTFFTSDGDILLQDPDSLRMRLPESFPATATLERRLFGSKWLTFTDRPGRSYKVKVRDSR